MRGLIPACTRGSKKMLKCISKQMADSRKNDESTEEVSQKTAAQVEDVPSVIQKITELVAEV